jgi:hypothetical protein
LAGAGPGVGCPPARSPGRRGLTSPGSLGARAVRLAELVDRNCRCVFGHRQRQPRTAADLPLRSKRFQSASQSPAWFRCRDVGAVPCVDTGRGSCAGPAYGLSRRWTVVSVPDQRWGMVVFVKRSYWQFFEWPALVPGDSAAC